MRITEAFHDRFVLSFEVFPPKSEAGLERLCSADGGVLERLCGLGPDYISCTYGAGGSTVGSQLDILGRLKQDGRTIPLAHITCIGNTLSSLRAQLERLLAHGIDHLLVLRGDLPAGWESTRGDLRYASEFVEFIRREFGGRFTIAVAGSPEGHIDSSSIEADIAFLKRKQDLGADYIMTQLCWDMEQFRRWLDAIRAAGIHLPVDAGVMPVLDPASTLQLALSRNGCALPRELCRLISRHWVFPHPFAKDTDDAAAAQKRADFREAGIAYTIRQIEAYRAMGVGGIHLYSMNRYEDAARIVQGAGLAKGRA